MVSLSTDRRSLLHLAGVVVLVAALAPFAVTAAPQAVGADHSYVVLSSSMSPAIHAGDVVVVNSVSADDLSEGDVITFRPPGGEYEGAERVTHRVVDVRQKDGTTYFETKGDANEQADGQLVPADNVVGEVWFHIPKVGYVVNFASTQSGVLLLVVVPALLLAVSEVYDLLVGDVEDTEE